MPLSPKGRAKSTNPPPPSINSIKQKHPESPLSLLRLPSPGVGASVYPALPWAKAKGASKGASSASLRALPSFLCHMPCRGTIRRTAQAALLTVDPHSPVRFGLIQGRLCAREQLPEFWALQMLKSAHPKARRYLNVLPLKRELFDRKRSP